ncbi:hypothetical protein [Roseibium algae]|uniref:Uncharacterized protein n=1 Tax=Roseibium algae TaxID=3123038 RepID=A0ABU8TGV9_9HYPH
MSEKTPRSASEVKSSGALENLYKPVGIAALAAATLCKGAKSGSK